MNRLSAATRLGALAFGLAALAGCGTIINGSSQSITLTGEPAGSTCEVSREGRVIGVVNPLPGSVTVAKSKEPLRFACSGRGYQPQVQTLASATDPWVWANFITGFGFLVDFSTGAYVQYPPSMTVNLTRDPLPYPSGTAPSPSYPDDRQPLPSRGPAS